MAVLSRRFAKRQNPSPGSGDSNLGTDSKIAIYSVVAVLAVGIICYLVWLLYFKPKGLRPNRPKKAKKETRTWFGRWRSGSNRGNYSAQLQPNASESVSITDGHSITRERSAGQNADVEMEIASVNRTPSARTNDAGVDRQTSVRSVMTLPPYSYSARPTEQVLGREGERAGVDVVIEQPETVDEEEERREDEMESLYQIRRARREEAAEREERRRLRREARARGDSVALARLQEASRRRAEAQAEGATISAQLIAEHQNKNRERRVSSVQYMDVGVARADGTRIRAASFDSDRQLLSSAASIGGSDRRESLSQYPSHQRERSISSVRSISSLASDDQLPHGISPDAGDFEVISLENSRPSSISPSTRDINRSRTSIMNRDEPPPNYEHVGWGNAPPYESPVTSRAPQLPTLAPIPAIEITGAVSPISRSSSTFRTEQEGNERV